MRRRWCPGPFLGLLALFASGLVGSVRAATERNNWAVLVDTSRYWYNYRHVANVLTFYHTIKRLGIPDSQIILMLGEDMACNARSARPGTVFNDHTHRNDLYGGDVEVDYRGDEVSVENFIRLLTGRHPPNTPRSKRLLTDSMSNIFIFITGHSGEEFIKFQDWEEITSNDLADAFGQMHRQKRYQNIFWVSDTCQASTLQNQFYSPNIMAIGSSGKKENSYSHHVDNELGVAVIDRFTYFAFDFLKALTPSSERTVQNFMDYFDPAKLHATPELRGDLYPTLPSETRMTDFLASTGRMRFQNSSMALRPAGPASVGAAESCSAGADPAVCSASPLAAGYLEASKASGLDTTPARASRPAEVEGVLRALSALPGFGPKGGDFFFQQQASTATDMDVGGISTTPLRWQGAFGAPDGAAHAWLLAFVCVLGASSLLL